MSSFSLGETADDTLPLTSILHLLLLQVYTCKFFLHTSSPGLFRSSRWPLPRRHNVLSLSQDLRLFSSRHMPEPPQPSHPQHITPHLLAISALLTRSLHVTLLLGLTYSIDRTMVISSSFAPQYHYVVNSLYRQYNNMAIDNYTNATRIYKSI